MRKRNNIGLIILDLFQFYLYHNLLMLLFLLNRLTAIARCRPAGALYNPFLPEFTEYIVYPNLDSHEEAAHNPIIEEPSQRLELVKILLKFPIDLDL